MDIQTFINQSWSDHAKNPQAVADQFENQIQNLKKTEDIVPFLNLISHVYIEHLCSWKRGKEILIQLQTHPLNNSSATQTALNRSIATFDYLIGEKSDLSKFSFGDQVRILATSASGFAASQDILKSKNILEMAVSIASTKLDEKDPAYKPLAMAGNNLACQLEEKLNRSSDETSLMLMAAKTARQFWEKAATWLEVERAEYRLSNSYLSTGDFKNAVHHAELCLEICNKNSADAMELFFATECFAKIHLKQNNREEFEKSLLQMENYLSQLNKEENPWCVRALDDLKNEIKH